MGDRVRVFVVFGGRSSEHEVSLKSAKSVMTAIDRERFEVVPIGITKEGRWLMDGDPHWELESGRPSGSRPVSFLPDPSATGLVYLDPGETRPVGMTPSDVVFPVLHGPNGEDGTIQGLLEMANVAYVGAGVLGSALGMDKGLMKTVFAQNGIPQVGWRSLLRSAWKKARAGGWESSLVEEFEGAFGYPMFVKPANLGSSVGVSKAKDRTDLIAALDRAAHYDRKILIEQFVDAREIECGVLGNEEPAASVLGEIVPGNEFYDYRAKYIDDNSRLIIPADLPGEVTQEVRSLALAAFRALDCTGLGRVDFFVERGTNRVLVNEINTIPGFTSISMYPKLWEASGLPYRDLITRLIDLALERHRDKNESSTAFDL